MRHLHRQHGNDGGFLADSSRPGYVFDPMCSAWVRRDIIPPAILREFDAAVVPIVAAAAAGTVPHLGDSVRWLDALDQVRLSTYPIEDMPAFDDARPPGEPIVIPESMRACKMASSNEYAGAVTRGKYIRLSQHETVERVKVPLNMAEKYDRLVAAWTKADEAHQEAESEHRRVSHMQSPYGGLADASEEMAALKRAVAARDKATDKLDRHCDRIRRHVAAQDGTDKMFKSDTGGIDARAIFDRIYRRHFTEVLPQVIADQARQMAFEDARVAAISLAYGNGKGKDGQPIDALGATLVPPAILEELGGGDAGKVLKYLDAGYGPIPVAIADRGSVLAYGAAWTMFQDARTDRERREAADMLLDFGKAVVAQTDHRALLWKRFRKADPIDLDGGSTFAPWSALGKDQFEVFAMSSCVPMAKIAITSKADTTTNLKSIFNMLETSSLDHRSHLIGLVLVLTPRALARWKLAVAVAAKPPVVIRPRPAGRLRVERGQKIAGLAVDQPCRTLAVEDCRRLEKH
jgi:hypothetical protein